MIPQRFLLLTIIILMNAAWSTSLAQGGYAVTQKGDTIYGKIKYNFFTGRPRLKTPGKIYPITTGEFNAYGDPRHQLVYRKIITPNAGTLWARLVTGGEIDLYQRVKKLSHNQKDITWYIQKGSSLTLPIKRSGIAGNLGRSHDEDILKSFIADNSRVLQEYESKSRYTFKNILHLVQIYNQSGDPSPGSN